MRTPQIIPVSELRTKHVKVFGMLAKGPIVLAQRSRPAAVLVSVAEWDQQADELARLQRIIQGDQAKAAINAGRYADHDEVIAALKGSA